MLVAVREFGEMCELCLDFVSVQFYSLLCEFVLQFLRGTVVHSRDCREPRFVPSIHRFFGSRLACTNC